MGPEGSEPRLQEPVTISSSQPYQFYILTYVNLGYDRLG